MVLLQPLYIQLEFPFFVCRYYANISGAQQTRAWQIGAGLQLLSFDLLRVIGWYPGKWQREKKVAG